MTRYLIKLKPLTPFFFGGELTFNNGLNEKDEKNYFAKSNRFPQQTTILGMLRKELLIQDELFKEKWADYSKENKAKMKELIGDKSFAVGKDLDFGKIDSISPVFIFSENNEYFIPSAKDRGLKYIKKDSCRSNISNENNFVPILKYDPPKKDAEFYNTKDGLQDLFISHKGSEKKPDQIFSEFEKTGNFKNKKESDDEKFYKQLFYQMEQDYSFAFFAEVDFELENSIVSIGADGSHFKIEVTETEESFAKLFIKNPEKNKITLLSNTLADQEIYEHCEFAITETINFRSTTLRKGKFKIKSDKESKRSKSDKFNMLKQGSVLYVKDGELDNLKAKLTDKNLQKIGYNIFK